MSKKEYRNYRLEDRVLFEAGAAAAVVDAAATEQNVIENQADAGDIAADMADAGDMLPVDAPVSVGTDTASGDYTEAVINAVPETISTGKELIVISSSVQDKDAILSTLDAGQDVLVLKAQNGLDELNVYLDAHSGTRYSAIHLLTHGSDGVLSVNGDKITADNFSDAPWKEIGEHLTNDGDLLLYGCDLAASESGKVLVDLIADASGADVSASIDTTGKSGNWQLEYTIGSTETDAIHVAGYSADLAPVTLTVDTNTDTVDDTDGMTTLREALMTAYANGGEYVIKFASGITDVYIENTTLGTIKPDVLGSDLDLTIDGDIDGDGETDVTINGRLVDDAMINFSTGTLDRTLNITLENLNVANAQEGAIKFVVDPASSQTGNLVLENVGFLNNASYNADGPALNLSNVSLSINNSYFKGNSTAVGNGGAIELKLSGTQTATITNTTFEGNEAEDATNGGAAINATLGGSSTLFVTNSTFYQNTTNCLGGGIHIMDFSTGNVTITNSTFTQNDAADGGAVYNAGHGLLTIENTLMVSNGDTDLYTDYFQKTRFSFSMATSVDAANSDPNTILTTFADSHIGTEYTFDAVFGSNTYDTTTHTITPDAFHKAAYGGKLVVDSDGNIDTIDQLGNVRTLAQTKLGIDGFTIGAVAAKLGITFTQNAHEVDYRVGGYSQDDVKNLTDRTLTYAGMDITDVVIDSFKLTYQGAETFTLTQIGTYQIDLSDIKLTLADSSTLPSADNDALFEIKYESGDFKINGLGEITVQDFSETNIYGDGLDLDETKEVITVSLYKGGSVTLYLDVTWEAAAAIISGNYSAAGHLNAGTYANALSVKTAKAYEKDSNGIYIDVTEHYDWNTAIINDLIVEKREVNVTVSATDITKVYDGTTAVMPDDKTGWLTVNNVASGETITGAGDWNYRDVNAGTDKYIDVTGINLTYSAADANNYTFAPVDLVTYGDITRKAVTVTIDPVSKVYDGTSKHTENYSGVINGVTIGGVTETLSWQATDGIYYDANGDATANATLNTNKGAASADFLVTLSNGSNGGLASNYMLVADAASTTEVTRISTDGEIKQRDIIVTGDSLTVTYDGADHTLNGVTADDLLTDHTISTTYSITEKNAGTYVYEIKAANYDQITIKNGAEDVTANYNIAGSYNGTLQIDRRAITVTANAGQTKVYGAADPTPFTYTVDNIVAGETLSGELTREAGENVGSYTILQGGITNANNANYDITYVSAEFTITAATLTVTAKDAAITYGEDALIANILATSYEVSGLQNGDAATVVTGSLGLAALNDAANYSTSKHLKADATDKYVFDIGSLTAGGNYVIDFVDMVGTDSRALTVNQKTLTTAVDFETTKVYDGTTSVVVNSAALTNLESGALPDDVTLNVELIYNDADVADATTISSKIWNISGADIANYILPDFVSVDGTITKRAVTVAAVAETQVYGTITETNLDNYLDYTVTGMVSGEENLLVGTLQIVDGEYTDGNLNEGTYSIIQKTAFNAGNNYDISYVPANLVVTAKSVALQWEMESSYTYNSLDQSAYVKAYFIGVDGDKHYVNVVFDGTGSQFLDAGIYTATTADSQAGDNYEYSGISINNLLMNQLKLTVTANDATMTYGDTLADADTVGHTNGTLGFDDTLVVEKSYQNSGTSTSGNFIAGTHEIKIDSVRLTHATRGDVTHNYDITVVSGELTVEQRAITVSGATVADKIYDGNETGTITAWDYSNHIDKDVFEFSGTATFENKNAYQNKNVEITDIEITGADAANYKLVDATGSALDTVDTTATINTKGITAVLYPVTKVYDGNTDAVTAGGVLTGMVGTEQLNYTATEGTYNSKNVVEADTAAFLVTLSDGNNGGLASNYHVENVNSNNKVETQGTITVASVVIDPGALTKEYDGTTNYADITSTVNGVNNEVVGYTLTGGHFYAADGVTKTANVLDAKTVRFDNAVLNDNGEVLASNYKITGVYDSSNRIMTSGTITAKAITVSAEDLSNVVYGNDFTLTYEDYSSQMIAGDDFSNLELEIDSNNWNSKNTALNVGDHTITFKSGWSIIDTADGNADVTANYEVTLNDAILEIIKATITIDSVTIADKTYDGTTAATVTDYTWSADTAPLAAGTDDAPGIGVQSAVFSDANAAAGKDVTVTFELTGADAGNYQFDNTNPFVANAAADILKKELIVTAVQPDPEIFGTVTESNLTTFLDYTVTGFVTGEETIAAVSGVLSIIDGSYWDNGTTKYLNVGDYKVTAADGALTSASANYSITFDANDAVLTINKAKVAVLVEAEKIYDDTEIYDPADGNHVITLVTDASGTLGDELKASTNFTLDSFTFSSDQVGTYSSTKDSTTGAVSINSPYLSGNYDLSAIYSGEITPRALTVDAGDYNTIYNGQYQTFKTADSVNDINHTVKVTKSISEKHAGTYVYDLSEADIEIYDANGNLVDRKNYDLTINDGILFIDKADIVVTGVTQSMTYGDAQPELIYTFTIEGKEESALYDPANEYFVGELALVNPQFSTSGNLKAGVWEIGQGTLYSVADQNAANGGNYRLTYSPGATLTVNQRNITVDSVDAVDRIYDGTDVAELGGYTLGNTMDGDLLEITAGKGNFDSKHASDNNGAASATFSGIVLGGTDAANYNIVDSNGNTITADTEYTDNDVTISRRDIEVWIDDAEKIYGTVDPEFKWFADNLCTAVNETVTDITRQPGENVGDYAIDQFEIHDADDADVTGNYNIVNFRPGTLTITQAEISVDSFVVTGLEKVYDGDAYVEDTAVLQFSFYNTQSGETETVTVKWEEGLFNSKNVGEDTSVTFTGLSSPDGNFVLTSTEATYEIAHMITPLTLTHDVAITTEKVYDGTVSVAVSGGLTNVIGNDNVVLNVEYQYNSANVAEANRITNTVWSITGADAKNYTLPTPAPSSDVAATITAKTVETIWLDESPYHYDNTDQSDTIMAFYRDILGNIVQVQLNWHGEQFILPGEYIVTAEGADPNYQLSGNEVTYVMNTVSPINVTNYSEGLNPNFTVVIPNMQNRYLASGRNTYADDAYHCNMNYPHQVSSLVLFQDALSYDDFKFRTSPDSLEFRPFTSDAVMRELSKGVGAGVHHSAGLALGEELFLRGSNQDQGSNDLLIDIQPDMDSSEAHLYIESEVLDGEGKFSLKSSSIVCPGNVFGDDAAEIAEMADMPEVKIICPVTETASVFRDDLDDQLSELLDSLVPQFS